MGLLAISAVVLIATMYGLSKVKRKKWETCVYLPLMIISLATMMISFCPISGYDKGKIQTVCELNVLNEGDEIYSANREWDLSAGDLGITITYKVTDVPEKAKYIFVNDAGELYYLTEDTVVCANINKIFSTSENKTYNATIVVGEYDKPYFESYLKNACWTFWSMGMLSKTEYIFYIPEHMISE